MDQGTYITATVMAVNEKGDSTVSRWNTSGAVVQKVPSMMNPPSGLRDESSDSVNLEWNEVKEPRDGGSAILTYVLKVSTDDEATWDILVGENDDNECVATATNDLCTFDSDKIKFKHADAGNSNCLTWSPPKTFGVPVNSLSPTLKLTLLKNPIRSPMSELMMPVWSESLGMTP